ncbi:MAG TPA: tRNA (adenosine(37)-N6)-threonylcarbamoyltransferase complex transferase subunit TsaD [Patescibacteria group bacterium]|nr:tRNA (adenosine(37)-N6)-threonylcarbamoyltransferase complex transferase subunit TsaD [Patescibacteria group bacterium]
MIKKISAILAIETSCDETAAAVIVEGQASQIRSSVIASQASLHAKFGGVVPEVAAREHVTAILPTIDLALKQARLKLPEIGSIAVTQGPGLMTSLLVGIETAKTLGQVLQIPVLPINHLEAHIYANFVKSDKLKVKSQKFPALILIVSGGHTLLVLMTAHGKYKILGETVDDAAGEAFDKTAKLLGLSYPGGPALSKLAEGGNPVKFNFPRPMMNSQNLNFSFSGLKTAVLYKVQEHKSLNLQLKSDFAASIQTAIVDVLIAKTENAIKKYHPKTIMLGGGVAANKLLREEFKRLATTYKLQPSIPKLEFCTDNAAMIGLAAYYKLKNSDPKFPKAFFADPNLGLK